MQRETSFYVKIIATADIIVNRSEAFFDFKVLMRLWNL
jgi:hypothetical protein